VYASEALVNASARSVDSSELLADLTFIKNRISAEEGKIA
jgi:hypothetical protein